MENPSVPATGYPIPLSHHPNGQPPVGTAYPYQAPPQQPTNLYYYNQAPFYSDRRATLIRRVIAAIIIITVIFFTVLFICWLVIRPHLPEFYVTALSLANFNVSTSSQSVTGDWNARFQVNNPNKKLKISYNDIHSSVSYKTEMLSETRIPPFKQDTKDVTAVSAAYSAEGSYFGGSLAHGMNGDRERGLVSFDLRVIADVGFKAGGLRARRRLLKVLCQDVAVQVSPGRGSGNFSGGARQCRVYA